MANPYVLRFSDPSKQTVVEIPEMPPGINTIDTSLSLVGRGYPNYGQKIAENFLHLLENFASAMPPENPVEGQLWYDTSDPNKKVLRVMDGTATSTRWPSASGIYQQGSDPRLDANASLRIGDIWVDTANSQLKIFNSNNWVVVGPITGGLEVTGPVVTTIEDTTGNYHNVIINYVNGDSSVTAYSGAVSIISDTTFTPKIVIPGFTRILTGINLSSKINETSDTPVFNGTAVRAKQLLTSDNQSFASDLFLRKNDQTPYGQIITGRVVFQTPPLDETEAQGINGVVVTDDATIFSTNYAQFYKAGSNAVILNNVPDGKIVFKSKTATTIPTNIFEISKTLVKSNENTVLDKTLTVNGQVVFNTNTNIVGTLSVASTATMASLTVTGVLKNSNKLVVGTTSGSGTILEPANTGTYSIGSTNYVFDRVYANYFGTGNSVFYGNLSGAASRLSAATNFSLSGQVRSVSDVVFNGESSTAAFNTVLHSSAISNQTEITTSTSNLTLLALNPNNSTLYKITKDNLLKDYTPTGMITAFGNNTNIPAGWLLCNGASLTRFTNYENLFSVIGYTYGGSGNSFNVPDFTSTAENGTIYYIIKA